MKKLLILYILLFVSIFALSFPYSSTKAACTSLNGTGCSTNPDGCCSPLVCMSDICVAAGQEQSNPLGQGDCDPEEIYTAIGCIPINYTDMINFFLRWGLGIAGGIAFLFIVYSGFMIITSSGNPDRLKAGQELLTSAIMGLMLIIFSVFILRTVGVDVLNLPGLF